MEKISYRYATSARALRAVIFATVLFSIILITISVAGGEGVSAASTSTVNEIEQKIAKLEESLKNIQNQLSTTQTSLDSELANKAYIDSRINTVNQDISTTEALIANYKEYIAVKEQEIVAKEQDIDTRFEEFCNWLNFTQKNETDNYLIMLFESQSFVEMLNSAERFESMVDYQTGLVNTLDAEIVGLENEKAKLEETKLSLEETEAGLSEKKAELDALAKDSARYINTLRNDQSALEQMKRDAIAQEEELNRELEAELERIAKQNTVYVGGDFMWPVDAKWSRISSGYGWRTLYGVKEFHAAIDIPASYGEYIYASNGGTVIKATKHNSYGNYIVIDHGGGKSTLYAHCSSLAVSEGDKVSQGDVIAYIGSTGYSTGNHIHFEVRINGERQNPLNYVSVPQ